MPKPAIKVVKPRNIYISQSLGYSSQALGYLSQALGYSSQALGYSFGGGKNKFYSGGKRSFVVGKRGNLSATKFSKRNGIMAIAGIVVNKKARDFCV